MSLSALLGRRRTPTAGESPWGSYPHESANPNEELDWRAVRRLNNGLPPPSIEGGGASIARERSGSNPRTAGALVPFVKACRVHVDAVTNCSGGRETCYQACRRGLPHPLASYRYATILIPSSARPRSECASARPNGATGRIVSAVRINPTGTRRYDPLPPT